MYILKRLILKEWIKFFLSSAFVLILLLTVANLISGFLRTNVTAQEVLINHLIEMPQNMAKILPISCLLATLFSVNKLKNRNELTAIFASGLSRKKFIINLIQVSLVVCLFQLFLTSYLQPLAKSNREKLIKNSGAKFRNLKSKGLSSSTIGSGKVWYKSQSYFFSFSYFNKNNNTLNNVTIYEFDEKNLLKSKTLISKLRHIKNDEWKSDQFTKIENLNDQKFQSRTKGKNKIFKLEESPSDFKEIESDITTLNINKLASYITKLKESGINTNEYEVLLYEKFGTSILCIIFTMIAAIGIFNPNRRGSSFGKTIGGVFIFTLVYWLISAYFLELGKSSKLNPFFSCFSIPMIFSIYLLWFFSKNRKLN